MSAPVRRTLPVAVTAAVALGLAAVWTALVDLRIVVPGPPAESADPEAGLRAYWAWYAELVPARQLGSFALLVGLAALTVTAANLGIARRRPMAAGAVAGGALFWAIAACVRLGTDRAVALLATHDNPIDPTNSIAFASSWLAAAFELVGSLLAGAGIIVLTTATPSTRPLAVVTGIALVVLGVCGYLPLGELHQWTQLVVGAVLLPWWLVVSGRALALDRARQSEEAASGAA